MYIPADAMNRVPTCGNPIAILTQFAFGGNLLYLCNGRQGRPRRFALFSSKTAGLIVFFRQNKGETTWLVVSRRCHVGVPGPACRKNYKPCTRARKCTKVKNVKVGEAGGRHLRRTAWDGRAPGGLRNAGMTDGRTQTRPAPPRWDVRALSIW